MEHSHRERADETADDVTNALNDAGEPCCDLRGSGAKYDERKSDREATALADPNQEGNATERPCGGQQEAHGTHRSENNHRSGDEALVAQLSRNNRDEKSARHLGQKVDRHDKAAAL